MKIFLPVRAEIDGARERHRSAVNSLITSAKIGSAVKGSLKNFWIARIGKKIVGCAGCEILKNGAAILTYCVVNEEFRHNGIGTVLTTIRMDFCRTKGIRLLALATMYYQYDHYKKLGFRICRRKQLPPSIQNYWMFTAKRYKKCGVMIKYL